MNASIAPVSSSSVSDLPEVFGSIAAGTDFSSGPICESFCTHTQPEKSTAVLLREYTARPDVRRPSHRAARRCAGLRDPSACRYLHRRARTSCCAGRRATGKAGIATSFDSPALVRRIKSENDISPASSVPSRTRSNTSRGLSIASNARSIPAGATSPAYSGIMRSYKPQPNFIGTFTRFAISRLVRADSSSANAAIIVRVPHAPSCNGRHAANSGSVQFVDHGIFARIHARRRSRDLTHAGFTVDTDAVGRRPQIGAFARDEQEAEVRFVHAIGPARPAADAVPAIDAQLDVRPPDRERSAAHAPRRRVDPRLFLRRSLPIQSVSSSESKRS